MNIVHFAPYGVNACGMYEAARDMVVADIKSGHIASFVDIGSTTTDYKKCEPKVGEVDNRGDVPIVTKDPSIANEADIIVAHTGVPDNWIVKNQAPVIVIMHGRPAASFAVEQSKKMVSYSLMAEFASWPRVKKMVTFWEHHVDFWKLIIPESKLVCFGAPPIDKSRFSDKGEKYDFGGKGGKWNIVIADTWRDDVNSFEIVNGAIEAAKRIPGIKVHLFAMPNPLPQCWEYLVGELRNLNSLGAIWGRRDKMEEVYRGADIVLSPQRIVTRSVGEPLCCGTPVIAANGCKEATIAVDTGSPKDVADGIEKLISMMTSSLECVQKNIKMQAESFSLGKYSERMNLIYNEVKKCHVNYAK